jgi:hypothetical protein
MIIRHTFTALHGLAFLFFVLGASWSIYHWRVNDLPNAIADRYTATDAGVDMTNVQAQIDKLTAEINEVKK